VTYFFFLQVATIIDLQLKISRSVSEVYVKTGHISHE